MRDIERMIDEAISAEERELLKEIGDEPGHFSQIAGMFTGPSAWISAALMVAQSVLFLAGCWAAWEFFRSTDALTALHWGLPASVAILASLVIKLSMWPTMHTNRIIRELKRVELQIAISKRVSLGER
jgi:hypothetical protein